MKRLTLVRHADYDRKTGEILNKEEIKKAVKKFSRPKIVFHGPILRLEETAAVIAEHFGIQSYEVPQFNGKTADQALAVLKRIEAGEEMFTRLASRTIIFKASEEKDVMFFISLSIQKIFDIISKGDSGMAVVSSSIAELAAILFGGKKIEPLSYLGTVELVQYTDGTISTL